MPYPKLNRTEISLVLVLILSAFAIRFYVASFPDYSGDVMFRKVWSKTVVEHGIRSIYDRSLDARCDYPPLIMYLLKPLGAVYQNYLSPSFDVRTNSLTIIMKLPALVADILTSLAIFLFVRKQTTFRAAYLSMLFYALNPGVIYNSAYWGQVDSIYTLFVVVSIFSLVSDKIRLSWLFISIGILTKTQSLSVLPIILLVSWKKNRKLAIEGMIVSLLVALFILSPFILHDKLADLIAAYEYSLSKYSFITVNAYNAWWPVNLYYNPVNEFNRHAWDRGVSDSSTLFGVISYKLLGMVLAGTFAVITLCTLNDKSDKNLVIYSSFALVFLSFMLLTRMHERYMFPVFALLSMTYFSHKRLQSIYVMLTFSYFFNLVKVLPSPSAALNFFNQIPYGSIMLTLVNLAAFLLAVYHIVSCSNWINIRWK